MVPSDRTKTRLTRRSTLVGEFRREGRREPDTAAVVKRLRPRFLRVRDPVRRETLAFRVGFPVLGAVVAVTFAWLITQA